MPQFNRRHFLQGAGAALAAVGLNQLDLTRWSLEYSHAVARNTPRKLAFLVGVNQYPQGIPSLNGCLTDVELHRELLIHRYGFKPQDLLTLTDDTPQKPTRNNLLQAFEEHLIKQAKPGDVVVFSYSGHGSRIVDPNPLPGSRNLNGTMVPADARPARPLNEPTSNPPPSKPEEVQDIMGRTLFLLMSALQTENVTVILDSCHSGGGLRGNALYRAIEPGSNQQPPQPSPQELAYQEQWLTRLNLTPQAFQERRQAGLAKGIGLGSARAEQPSADVNFGDFYAGAFTYLLTRYLWQQTSPQTVQVLFADLAYQTKTLAKSKGIYQDPRYDTKPGSHLETSPLFNSPPLRPAAEAVVRQDPKGNALEFWLGGMSPELISTIGVYDLIDDRGEVIGEVEQTHRRGLVAQGLLRRGEAKAGMLLREHIRGLPANLGLVLGIEPAIASAQAVIQAALTNEPRIQAILLGDRPSVDYRLGRMDAERLHDGKQLKIPNLGEVGTLGLFTAGLLPFEASFGSPTESVAEAIKRLTPTLKGLLANKILGSLSNGERSSLNVSVSLRLQDKTNSSTSNSSRGAQEKEPILATRQLAARKFRVGDKVLVDITNHEKSPLYIGLIIISSAGEIGVNYPPPSSNLDELPLLKSGQTLTIPKNNTLEILPPAGFFEIYAIASSQPIRESLLALRRLADQGQSSRDQAASRGAQIAQEKLNALDVLLGDLDRNTRSSQSIPNGYLGVDLQRIAAISTVVEVIDP